MKSIFLYFILFSLDSFAGYQRCPSDWFMSNQHTQKILESIQGTSTIGDCKIEIHACHSEESATSSDLLVADMLITYHGNFYYVPLFSKQNSGLSGWLTSNADQIFYRFSDDNTDPLNGHSESNSLKISLNTSGTAMAALELSVKNRHDFSKFIFWNLPESVVCQYADGYHDGDQN